MYFKRGNKDCALLNASSKGKQVFCFAECILHRFLKGVCGWKFSVALLEFYWRALGGAGAKGAEADEGKSRRWIDEGGSREAGAARRRGTPRSYARPPQRCPGGAGGPEDDALPR